MVKIIDIINKIEEFAPLSLAEDFDNCGLKIGNVQQESTGVLITVDTNIDVVKEAIEKKANLIIEHHPSIWRPLRSIDPAVPLNAALLEAAKHDIVVYSSHTNVDYTDGGLNDAVAKSIGLTNIGCISGPSSARVGDLAQETILRDYAKRLIKVFDDDNISVIGDLNKKIRKVAVINGGGGGREEVVWDAIDAGSDVFVTAEVKHNVARLANNLNYAIIQVGHYSSEKEFIALMKKILNGAFDDLPVYGAKSIGSPYNRRGEI